MTFKIFGSAFLRSPDSVEEEVWPLLRRSTGRLCYALRRVSESRDLDQVRRTEVHYSILYSYSPWYSRHLPKLYT